MRRRVGIDLSGSAVALAHVGEGEGTLQLRGFALIETGGDVDTIAGELREARRAFRLPKHAEVIAWPGDIRPDAVRQAGFVIERIISPMEALARVARLHHGAPTPERVSAVACVHQESGAVVVIRDGHLLHEASMKWPLDAGAVGGRSELLRRYAFLAELTESLRAAFHAVSREHGVKVTEILTCGSLPDLRSLTMPLAEEFDVEVETLDSTAGITLRLKRESAERAQEVMAALRLAVVAGRRWGTPPAAERSKRGRTAGAVAAAAAAIVLAVYLWPWGTSSREAPRAAARTTSAQPQQPARGQAATRPDRSASPLRQAQQARPTVPEQAARASAPGPPAPGPPALQAPEAVGRSAPPALTARALETRRAPSQQPPSPPTGAAAGPSPSAARRDDTRPGTSAPAPVVRQATLPQQAAPSRQSPVPQKAAPPQVSEARPATTTPRPVMSAEKAAPRAPSPARDGEARVDPPATRRSLDQLPPFPVSVSSIMWSPDRQFAVVDGRILGVGDSIGGARVVEIHADALIVRDVSGRLRRAGLGR